jgi:dinuclear metal center YbgI/SA1388 family protein
VGQLVGDAGAPLTSALFCLDITPAIVEEAASCKAQLIVSHHPVIFDPLRRLSAGSVPYLLARAGIAAICAHTNLDLADGGVNDCLCASLGLHAVTGLEPAEGGMLGRVGVLPAPMDEQSFALHVKASLGCGGLRMVPSGRRIETVAVCGGSGGSLLPRAAACGAQALVTADVKHNQLFEAMQLGLCLIDAGHFETENVVVEPLCAAMATACPEVTCRVARYNTPPARWL